MDGDQSAKTMDAGAQSGMNALDMTDGIHEAATNKSAAGEKTTGTGVPAFNKDGAIGSMFKADGTIGSTADKVGGPFAKDGFIGEKFNADGGVGGTIQERLGKKA
ncbi:MAG: hypothetical protein M1818_001413 [Claussenomyces sp. TS43310]|nr:MAG: hypothetical protein M1818_001413 [Claussenomyces sp. TS43310]